MNDSLYAIQPYETRCVCHNDDWLTDSFRMEHETEHFRNLYQAAEKQRVRLFNLIEFYNGDPVLMMIRDRDIRRRHRWVTNKETELENKDEDLNQRAERIHRRESEVAQREQRVQEREQRLARRVLNTEQ